jgi:ssDNA-binding Zn-finger/Zn-ribbon topoisomerase 1
MTIDLNKKISMQISLVEIEKTLDLIFASNLDDVTKEFLKESLRALVKLDQLVGANKVTIARLRKIFDKQSEKNKSSNTLPVPPKPKNHKGRVKGQGNFAKDDYANADKKKHFLSDDKKENQICPDCNNGKLKTVESEFFIRLTGSPTAKAVIHEAETTECLNCGAVFVADFEGKSQGKYDLTLISIIAIMHYLGSFPFYRLEKIQKMFVTPLPRSVQWDLMNSLAKILEAIWQEMLNIAREANSFYIDDTGNKILTKTKELKELPKGERKKLQTTGIIAEVINQFKMVMFFTGIKYAGENMKDLLEGRISLDPVMIMSDALNQNNVKNTTGIVEINCNAHGRRKFQDIEKKYEKEKDYILDLISTVYLNEKTCKENNYTGKIRLLYHQENSTKSMTDLKDWLDGAFEKKITEPNSSFGKSIQYMLNHWEKLIGFLKYEDAALDNNLLEGTLRTPVLNRKNWLFYKTERGALVGDIILSILKTCSLNKKDPFAYLNFIQANANEIESAFGRNEKLDPRFLPWNFKS